MNCTRHSRVLFGSVTSLINAKIARAVMQLVVNHMLDSNSSGKAISGA